jgi:hypothetical protein
VYGKEKKMIIFLSGLFLGMLFGLVIMAIFSAGKREGEAREKIMQKI